MFETRYLRDENGASFFVNLRPLQLRKNWKRTNLASRFYGEGRSCQRTNPAGSFIFSSAATLEETIGAAAACLHMLFSEGSWTTRKDSRRNSERFLRDFEKKRRRDAKKQKAQEAGEANATKAAGKPCDGRGMLQALF